MRSSRALLIVVVMLLVRGVLFPDAAEGQNAASSHQYKDASPGYRYSFPRDHFNHSDFRTEWWYYTGNLKSASGQSFGFQLAFFRQAVRRGASHDSAWAIDDVYLAHAALSDISGGKFYHSERLNRAGPGIAGVSQENGRIWNGNWQIVWTGDRQKLNAVTAEWNLQLMLNSRKPPVINGEQGISRKGAAPGEASHYISLTQLAATGTIELGGQTYAVDGSAWMDHEFFTNQLAPEQIGWDWLSAQLGDQTELMFFRLRRKDGSIDPFSAATYVDRDGQSRHLSSGEFTLRPLDRPWTSPVTGATYPLRWQLIVPSLNLNVEISARLPQQEMTASGPASPNYWEGAIEITGTHGKAVAPISGVGYLEMTGYDRPVSLGR